MIKYYYHSLLWYNSSILYTHKINFNRKAPFSENEENKFSFINSMIMKSFKTMDLPFNYKKFLDVPSNIFLQDQIKEVEKKKSFSLNICYSCCFFYL